MVKRRVTMDDMKKTDYRVEKDSIGVKGYSGRGILWSADFACSRKLSHHRSEYASGDY